MPGISIVEYRVRRIRDDKKIEFDFIGALMMWSSKMLGSNNPDAIFDFPNRTAAPKFHYNQDYIRTLLHKYTLVCMTNKYVCLVLGWIL